MTQPTWNELNIGEFTIGDSVDITLSVIVYPPATEATFSILNGQLPPGLSLVNSHIIGTVSQGGTFTCTIRATDTYSQIRDKTLTITVDSAIAPEWGVSGLLFTVNDATWVDFDLTYTTYSTPLVELVSGELPDGLELSSTGKIRGWVNVNKLANGNQVSKTSEFTLSLADEFGAVDRVFTAQVNVQSAGTRVPVILTDHPEHLEIPIDDPYRQFYTDGYIGTYQSGDPIVFKVIARDFDNDDLTYEFTGLPSGLIGNDTGWITGNITLTTDGITQFEFDVTVKKTDAPLIVSDTKTFTLNVQKNINDTITWVTDTSLISLYNGEISSLSVYADSDTELNYEVTSGQLPENLELNSDGQIVGQVSLQLTEITDQRTYIFTVTATSSEYSFISASKQFSLTVIQAHAPYDYLYFKATPDVESRELLDSVLSSSVLFPDSEIFRPYDEHFGVSRLPIFPFVYGVKPTILSAISDGMSQSHYNKRVVFGELQTAVAQNYEVVYLPIIDQLDGANYTRAIDPPITHCGNTIYALYPNTYANMLATLSKTVNITPEDTMLPQWMRFQQPSGETLGFTRAWVLCYTKVGKSATIKQRLLDDGINFNEIDFTIDRYYVDKSSTFNYNEQWETPVWSEIPGGVPTPSPLNSKDHMVSFPRLDII